ncbi:MAG: ABC transporter permease [Devosia sp.]
MFNYILRRLLFAPVVLIALTLMIFSLQAMLSPMQRLAAYAPSPEFLKGGNEQAAALIEKYGLDDPIWEQYARWLGNLLQGNMGWSETARAPVAEILMQLFPATAELVLISFALAFGLSVLLGTLAATHLNRLPDHIVRMFTTVGWSFPPFVFGLVFLMIGYGWLNWFPPGRLSQWAVNEISSGNFRSYTGANTVDAILNWNWPIFWNAVQHLVAPVITLVYVNLASMTRIMRGSMLETLRQDYVRTARAKGLVERVVENKHARRNALLPVVTVAGMEMAYMLGGVVITETIFDYRGLGLFSAQAASSLDFPAVLGFGLYFAVVLVVINLIVDLLYPLLDPRVKLQ